jgi:hypothetical protein
MKQNEVKCSGTHGNAGKGNEMHGNSGKGHKMKQNAEERTETRTKKTK